VRPLSSLRLVVAPPAYEPGKDTSVIANPRLYPFAPGRPPLVAVRWPEATGLTSYLSGCFSLTGQRCCLAHIAGVLEGFHRPCLGQVVFPDRTLTLSRPSAPFVWRPYNRPPESPAPCWVTVATLYPLGNCDSLGPETSPR